MANDSLRTLARQLDVPERTLRRAAAQELIRGRRLSERRYKTTLREEAYLRSHWELRRALRTEPGVRLAVLFGSLARGEGTESSDVDLLVLLRDDTATAVAALSGRLSPPEPRATRARGATTTRCRLGRTYHQRASHADVPPDRRRPARQQDPSAPARLPHQSKYRKPNKYRSR